MCEELKKRGSQITEDVVFDDADTPHTAENESFWIPIRRFNPELDKMTCTGSLLCSLRMYPVETAEKFPQGEGREEPNSDPNCPEPEGRLKLTLNPFEMFN